MRKLMMMGAAAMMLTTMTTSCSKETDVYDEYAVAKEAKAKYEQAFITRFGQPSQTQSWGFDEENGTQAITRGGTKYQIPSPTDAEITKAQNIFSNLTSSSESDYVNMNSFMVQQVYSTRKASNMLKLYCAANSINNVENANEVKYFMNGEWHNNYEGYQLPDGVTAMNNASTLHWAYTYEDRRKTVIGNSFKIKKIGEYYYVGFAYDNGGFDDWIVRIIPMGGVARVIAEDLTVGDANTDFDFNDVVFDVDFTEEGIEITLQAAGGTLPLYVDGREVHELFGVPVTTMVNTKNGSVEKESVKFMASKQYGKVKDIPVEVEKGGKRVTLEAVKGKVASKIQVKPTYTWCDERTDIEQKYPDFAKWVKNEQTNWY